MAVLFCSLLFYSVLFCSLRVTSVFTSDGKEENRGKRGLIKPGRVVQESDCSASFTIDILSRLEYRRFYFLKDY